MYKSIADIFNSPEAIFNDPLYEIHNPIKPCKYPPEIEEYQYFIEYLDCSAYPKPDLKVIHNIINPLHGSLKSIY